MQAPVQVLTAGPDDGPDKTPLGPGVSNDSMYSVRPPDAVVVDKATPDGDTSVPTLATPGFGMPLREASQKRPPKAATFSPTKVPGVSFTKVYSGCPKYRT